jgi:hypothetical protein
MKTLREKISFVLTACAYALFHMGQSPETGSIVGGTLMALQNTLAVEIGLTLIIVTFLRHALGGTKLPWDRIARIFFTVGIIIGLMYNLYVRGVQSQPPPRDTAPIESPISADDSRKDR